MYYQNLNTVFVQITKNASTSVDSLLSLNPLETHVHETLESTQIQYGCFLNDETYYFAIVRDPIDRFISAYCYLVEERRRQIEFEGPDHAWKLDPIETLEVIRSMTQSDVHGFDMVFLTQVHFLQPLANTNPNLDLLAYENLQQEWPRVAQILRTRGQQNLELPFSNRTISKQGPWKDPVFLNLVQEIYSKDFELHSRAQLKINR